MNLLTMCSRVRALISNPLFKKTQNGKPLASQSIFYSRSSLKPHLSYNSSITLSKNYDVSRRAASKWTTSILERKDDNHSYIWTMERITSIGSLTSFIAMFIHPCENADLFFAFIVTLHAHWGLEAMFTDYLRPSVVGNFIPKLIPLLSLLTSGFMLVFLSWVSVYGNGIAGSLQQLWYLDATIEPYDREDSKLFKQSE